MCGAASRGGDGDGRRKRRPQGPGRDYGRGKGWREGGRGRGSAKMQRGGLRGQNKEGAKGRKAKQWGKDSAEEYQRLDAQKSVQ